MVLGKATTIYAPDFSCSINGYYAAVPVSWPVPSHDPSGGAFKERPDFNQSLQPRSMNRQAEKAKVVDAANRLVPRNIVNESPLASTAMPVARISDGNLIAGNGRWMALMLAAEINKEGYRATLDLAQSEAAVYGIDPAAMQALSRRVGDVMVIRVVDCDDATAVRIVANFNRRESQVEPLTQIAFQLSQAQGKQLSELVFRYEADSMAKLLDMPEANADAMKILRNGLGPRDAEAYIDTTHDGQMWLNSIGRDLIFRAAGLFAAGSKEMAEYIQAAEPAIMQRIVAAGKPMAEIRALLDRAPERMKLVYSLDIPLQDAICAVTTARRFGACTVEEIVRQQDLLSTDLADVLDECPTTRAIAAALLDTRVGRLRYVLEHYLAALEVKVHPEQQLFGGGYPPGVAAWVAQQQDARYRKGKTDPWLFPEQLAEMSV
jgi:hypothetical protein